MDDIEKLKEEKFDLEEYQAIGRCMAWLKLQCGADGLNTFNQTEEQKEYVIAWRKVRAFKITLPFHKRFQDQYQKEEQQKKPTKYSIYADGREVREDEIGF